MTEVTYSQGSATGLLAAIGAGWFETASRDNGDSFTRLRDGAPGWLKDVLYAAHGDGEWLPDDWRYSCTLAALEWVADNDGADDDSDHEFADSYVDVYTSALTAWLASSVRRTSYVDEAREEGLIGDSSDVIEAIRVGQYGEAREVFTAAVEKLEEIVEDELTVSASPAGYSVLRDGSPDGEPIVDGVTLTVAAVLAGRTLCEQCGGTGQRATATTTGGRELARHERSGTACDACNGTGLGGGEG